ncbi:hypothetical protein GGR25_004715 [Kaistia hirudinis]|uniref:Uncharacterized protein n=1 Tax=Kaistia hirudinis TaxID=1293440 RepID=A0A840AVD3_9HYPH|nr:hypothetical protein [Kaistia hirudinis]
MRSRTYAPLTAANSIVYREITGWPKNVTSRLNRKLSALCRHGAYHVKIGITNSPSTRWKQAYRSNGWSRMHVI